MRTIHLAAVAATAFAFPASFAVADDIMASRYGNTTISTDANGVQTRTYYNADGTFTGKQGTENFAGTWKLDGGNVCLTFAPAPSKPSYSFCVPASAHKVGDTWAGVGSTVTLVKGIQ